MNKIKSNLHTHNAYVLGSSIIFLIGLISVFLLYRNQIISNEISSLVITRNASLVDSQATVITSINHTQSADHLPSGTVFIATTSTSTSPTPLPAPTRNEISTKEISIESLPTTESRSPRVSPPAPAAHSSTLAERIHSLTNQRRADNNIPTLVLDNALSKIANARSEEMIALKYFSHTSTSGCNLKCTFSSAGYISELGGENLAEMTSYTSLSDQELSKSFVIDWLQSPLHKENLLSSNFTNQGIGIAYNENRIVVTVLFSKK